MLAYYFNRAAVAGVFQDQDWRGLGKFFRWSFGALNEMPGLTLTMSRA